LGGCGPLNTTDERQADGNTTARIGERRHGCLGSMDRFWCWAQRRMVWLNLLPYEEQL
jgi:hypothetical protein